MPVYDRICPDGHQMLDCFEPVMAPAVTCKDCHKPTERAWLSKPSAVIPDDIAGGVWIRHGLCHPDGSPRRFFSRSEIAAEAKRQGLTNVVRHVGVNGSDKSPHTVSWATPPSTLSDADEQRRREAWHAHESQLQKELMHG